MNKNKRKNKPIRINNKIIRGITKSGFRFYVNSDVFKDMEVLEILYQIEDNPILIPKFLEKTLGKKQKENLYNFVRNDKGTVPAEKVSEIALEIFESKELKNFFTLPR